MKTDKEIIAEFMGLGYMVYPDGSIRYTHKNISGYRAMDLEYSISWDWLMPVVEKIKNTDIHHRFDEYHGEQRKRHLLSLAITSPIHLVYLRTVEFIKWFYE